MQQQQQRTFTHGGKIAIKPPAATGIKVNVNKGFATVEQRTVLAEVEVVFPSYDPNAWAPSLPRGHLFVDSGDKLLVNASALAVQVLNIQKLGDVEFVLIDAAIVYVAQRPSMRLSYGG